MINSALTISAASRQPKLADDPDLLASMLDDAPRQSELYRPGPYWRRKTEVAAQQLRRGALADFRGATSTVGVSFADATNRDVRLTLVGGWRGVLGWFCRRVPPFNRLFDAQVAITRNVEMTARRFRAEIIQSRADVSRLLSKYVMPASLTGGCLDVVMLNGDQVSMHYLAMLHQHDHVAQRIDFTTVRSMIEIGPGFGANVHLLLENYPNLRKVVCVDIPPNLYVGTQYLRAFYGDAVKDYRTTRAMGSSIAFTSDDYLEILCIAPWQIERLEVSVDLAYNAHSFVEMPRSIVDNYAMHLQRLDRSGRMKVALLSYDNYDLSTTFDPDTLPAFFPGRRFARTILPSVTGEPHQTIAFVSD